MKSGSLLTMLLVAGCATASTTSNGDVVSRRSIDWKTVEDAIGRPGVSQPGGVYRFNFPRGDLHVMVGDVQVKPALALGGWVAFKESAGGAIAAGDLVLTDDEVNPVISALQSGGVEQTAVHHHILGESPRVIYMHVHGHGDPLKIAAAIRSAVAVTRIPAPAPASAPSAIAFDSARVTAILRVSGRSNGGVLQFSIPRAETIREMGEEIPPSMGVATAINFQPTGGGRAAITGDFVLTAAEVNPVIRALRDNGISVTSLHSHMLMEEPRLFFMHFWANDDAVRLAGGLRAALDRTNSR